MNPVPGILRPVTIKNLDRNANLYFGNAITTRDR
jgi:hypothetical protein